MIPDPPPWLTERPAWRDPLDVFHPLRDAPMSLLMLGGGAGEAGRLSWLFADPIASDIRQAASGDPLASARRWAAEDAAAVAGFISYDIAHAFDGAMPLPPPSRLPLLAAARYGAVAAFDHAARTVVANEAGARLVRAAAKTPAPHAADGAIAGRTTLAAYAEGVAALVARIHAGDLYQANLSRSFEGRLGGGDHPFDLFRRLAANSPAPFASYLRLPGAAIVSNAPERFLRTERCGGRLHAVTEPIKGTRPRGATPAEDEAFAAALRASEKDRAENLMIVDLMRNDLARVSVAGTVRVPELFALRSFANVHHLVSSIRATLRPGMTNLDLLAAAFPAGSISGAPKIKAMELIRAFERGPREANYGAMFRLFGDDSLDSSVLIRTAACFESGGAWEIGFRVGGGIVADSDPIEEGEETEVKARSLIAAITGRRS